MTGLEPGHKYEFRVRAHNDEGESDPLDSDRPVLAKDPFGKATTSRKCLIPFGLFTRIFT